MSSTGLIIGIVIVLIIIAVVIAGYFTNWFGLGKKAGDECTPKKEDKLSHGTGYQIDEDGKCSATTCDTGYTLDAENYECKKDTVTPQEDDKIKAIANLTGWYTYDTLSSTGATWTDKSGKNNTISSISPPLAVKEKYIHATDSVVTFPVSNLLTTTNTFTVFQVMRYDASTDGMYKTSDGLLKLDTTEGVYSFGFAKNSPTISSFSTTASTSADYSVYIPVDTFAVYTNTGRGSRVNSSPLLWSSAPSMPTVKTTEKGVKLTLSNSFNAKEIVIFDRELNPNEQKTVEDYLLAKHGLSAGGYTSASVSTGGYFLQTPAGSNPADVNQGHLNTYFKQAPQTPYTLETCKTYAKTQGSNVVMLDTLNLSNCYYSVPAEFANVYRKGTYATPRFLSTCTTSATYPTCNTSPLALCSTYTTATDCAPKTGCTWTAGVGTAPGTCSEPAPRDSARKYIT